MYLWGAEGQCLIIFKVINLIVDLEKWRCRTTKTIETINPLEEKAKIPLKPWEFDNNNQILS